MNEFTAERYIRKCLELFFWVVYLIILFAAAFLLGKITLGIILAILVLLLFSLKVLYEKWKRSEGNHGSNRMDQSYQMPIYSVSSSVPQTFRPPPYPEVEQDSPGLPPPIYTTRAIDEASGKVVGPSSDGLPSYEAAMSTWQPPVDEGHLTLSDYRSRTND